MTVAPVSSIQSVKSISPLKDMTAESIFSPTEKKQDFKDALLSLVDNAERTETVTRDDAYKLSIGEVDDLHTIMINSAKADIALQMMVQLRNKALDAYSEVMRINL